jgi:hypothetical protein
MTEPTKPGVYDMPAEEYHAHPALSSTGARRLMPPSCPALFQHERLHGRPDSRAFDIGHAAHLMVLGSGPELVVVEAENWRTKAAQAARDQAYAEGKTPLLEHEHDEVQEMAEVIRRHPVAGKLLDPARGRAEQSLFWRDSKSGVDCRARLDFLPHPTSGRLLVPDYKTTTSVEPKALAKAVHKFGYHQQDDWYKDAVYANDLAERVAFLFVFQEKVAPYLVTVVELGQDFLTWAAVLNDKARDIFRRCTDTGAWPGYSDGIEQVFLPTYAEHEYEAARMRGDFDITPVTQRDVA